MVCETRPLTTTTVYNLTTVMSKAPQPELSHEMTACSVICQEGKAYNTLTVVVDKTYDVLSELPVLASNDVLIALLHPL